MPDNKTLILEQFEQHKGQFIIMGTKVVRFVAIAEDDMDYYYVCYDGRKIHWHSCVGRFVVLKGKIDERDYNDFIRIAELNHFDQTHDEWSNTHKEQITYLPENHTYLAEVCWDIN